MDHSCVISPSQSYTATLVRLKAKFYRSKPGQNTNEIYHVMLFFVCVVLWAPYFFEGVEECRV